MGAGTSAEEFFLKSINVESIFEFVERTDYLFLYSIKAVSYTHLGNRFMWYASFCNSQCKWRRKTESGNVR